MHRLWISRVEAELQRLGITPTECARRAELPYTTFRGFLVGDAEPSFEKQRLIAAAIGVPVWALLVEKPAECAAPDEVSGLEGSRLDAYRSLQKAIKRHGQAMTEQDLWLLTKTAEHLGHSRVGKKG